MLANSPKSSEKTKKFARSNNLILNGDIIRNNLYQTPIKKDNSESGTNSEKATSDKLPSGDQQIKTDSLKRQCYYCKQTGHLARSCKWKTNHSFQPTGLSRYYKRSNDRRVNFKSQRNSPRHFIDIRENSKNSEATCCESQ